MSFSLRHMWFRLNVTLTQTFHTWSNSVVEFLVVSCHAAFEETSRFLTDNGLGHVSQQFVEEEIEVRQIPSLPDQVLADLGVRTVGARLRLRSAASQWVPNQVISILSLEISFVQIFFQIRLFPFSISFSSPWVVQWLTRRAEEGLQTISRIGIDATFKVSTLFFVF